MNIQIIEKNGAPEYAIVPFKAYQKLCEKADEAEDIRAYDTAKDENEELLPRELAEKLIAGENKIKLFREYRGLSQAILAKKSGLTQPMIALIEKSKREPSVKSLKRLAEVLDLDLVDLI